MKKKYLCSLKKQSYGVRVESNDIEKDEFYKSTNKFITYINNYSIISLYY